MSCQICRHGELSPGKTIVTLQQGDTTVILKGVPAEICDDCGEYYLSDDIADRVLALAEQAVQKGAEVEILRFAA